MAIFRINMKCGACAARIQRSILAIDDEAKIGVNAREKVVQSGDRRHDACWLSRPLDTLRIIGVSRSRAGKC
jgi:hypothetical protein